jgi:hypothetical protein
VKYAWIDTRRDAFGLMEMCDRLGVSISGYRAWKRGSTPNRKSRSLVGRVSAA